MMKGSRQAELAALFAGADEKERVLVDRLIAEAADLEDRMDDLKRLPFIIEHPTKAGLMKTTPAAKLYKELSQSYMNAVRILLNVLRKTQPDAADELLKRLEEFEA